MPLSDNDSISPYTEFTSRDGGVTDNEDVADGHDEIPHFFKNNAEFAWEDLPVADLLNFRRRIFALALTVYPNKVLRIMWRENRTPDVVELAVSLVRPDGLSLLVGPLAVGCGAAYQALLGLMEGILEGEKREKEKYDGDEDDEEKVKGGKVGGA